MLLPSDFEQKISNHFYDKEIEVLNTQKVLDVDGGLVRNIDDIALRFSGNARLNAMGIAKNDIGLSLDADIIITCDKNILVELDNIIKYLGHYYVVTEIIPSDSHLKILGKICQ